MHVHLCVYAYRALILISGVFLDHSHEVLRQGLSRGPTVYSLASIASQLAPGILSPLLNTGITWLVFTWGAGVQTPNPHTSVASVLPAELWLGTVLFCVLVKCGSHLLSWHVILSGSALKERVAPEVYKHLLQCLGQGDS